MGYSTGENSLDKALSPEESPIFMSENQFWIIFDIVMFSGFVIFLLCACKTFCMYARGYRLHKRASSLRFEEELTAERSSASSDLFADRTVVWVTGGGRCYHKPGCKWTLHGGHTEMTESAAILANPNMSQLWQGAW